MNRKNEVGGEEKEARRQGKSRPSTTTQRLLNERTSTPSTFFGKY
jgi:hypothetical protein